MAVVDSDYKYVFIDVGAEGRQSDGGVLKNSKFGRALINKELDTPPPARLPGATVVAPYVFVGDEAFQLREDFMRPYPAKQLRDDRIVFNYRLSRARYYLKVFSWPFYCNFYHNRMPQQYRSDFFTAGL